MKLIKILNSLGPFNNIYKNILLYLFFISPILNTIFINIYYYNCGGHINSIYSFISIFNPFVISNPLCALLMTIITGNLYLFHYIYIIIILFIISLFLLK